MEFEERIKSYAGRIKDIKKTIKTEEATKTSLIMPFFQILGFDIFNPNEFIPEYVADVGIKKGEKVDYAIVLNGELVMLIEAKSTKEKLEKYDSQLFRYFGTTKAKFAILTNGLRYKFYTDLEEQNVMDTTPFLEIDLEDLKDTEIQYLSKFKKENFDITKIFDSASYLKYLNSIKNVFKEEFENPSDDFVRTILNKGIYNGVKTSSVIDRYKPLIKKSFNTFINEQINEKLQSVMGEEQIEEIEDQNEVQVETTFEEIQSFYIVKSILSEHCSPKKISYKDTLSYFGILYDNKVTKWICRIYIKDSVKFLTIQQNKKEVRYDLQTMEDIYKYKNEIITRLKEVEK